MKKTIEVINELKKVGLLKDYAIGGAIGVLKWVEPFFTRDLVIFIIPIKEAEKEVKANVAIWPINFTEVDNNLPKLYETVQQKTDRVVAFLKEQGFSDSEITVSLPSIEDRQAQGYVDPNVRYRYSAKVNLSVYTPQIDLMLNTRKQMINLVKEGIAIASQDYDNRTEFLFTDLNSVKPIMVQEIGLRS